jgi:Tol biopolymer transport system component
VFARQGNLQLRYPDGGGGSHMIYDLFYAYADSSNNWWEGITQTMGALAPEFTSDGSKVLFVYDLNANKINSTFPKYRLALWDTKTFKIKTLEFDPASEMVAFTPTMSPDMTQVAFVVMRLRGQQLTPTGIAIAKLSEFPLADDVLEQRAEKLGNGTAPSWSPDGKWIAYVSNDMSHPGIHLVSPDLSQTKVVYEPKAPTAISATAPSWSPDSKMLLFSTQDGAIYKISIDGGDPVRLSGPGNDYNPSWCN